MRTIKPQTQEAQQTPSPRNTIENYTMAHKNQTPKHQCQEKLSKVARGRVRKSEGQERWEKVVLLGMHRDRTLPGERVL